MLYMSAKVPPGVHPRVASRWVRTFATPRPPLLSPPPRLSPGTKQPAGWQCSACEEEQVREEEEEGGDAEAESASSSGGGGGRKRGRSNGAGGKSKASAEAQRNKVNTSRLWLARLSVASLPARAPTTVSYTHLTLPTIYSV